MEPECIRQDISATWETLFKPTYRAHLFHQVSCTLRTWTKIWIVTAQLVFCWAFGAAIMVCPKNLYVGPDQPWIRSSTCVNDHWWMETGWGWWDWVNQVRLCTSLVTMSTANWLFHLSYKLPSSLEQRLGACKLRSLPSKSNFRLSLPLAFRTGR